LSHWEQPSISDLLQQLALFDESDRIEVKTGSEAGKSILETGIAFASRPRVSNLIDMIEEGSLQGMEGEGEASAKPTKPASDPTKLASDPAKPARESDDAPKHPKQAYRAKPMAKGEG